MVFVDSIRELWKGSGNVVRRAVRTLQGKPVPDIVRAVRQKRLTYLEENALFDLYDEVRRSRREGVEGVLIEAGCALGGSAIVIASAKEETRPLYVYDVFDMIPVPSEHDDADVHERYREIESGTARGIGGDTYYGYMHDLYDRVRSNFTQLGFPPSEHDIQFIKGLFQDTLHVDEPVALAHIDGDWYESVKICLKRIEPHLSPGGVLVVDDYYCWSGCRKAVDDYFADRHEGYTFVRKSRLQIHRASG